MLFCGQEEPLCANHHIMVYADDQHVYRSSAISIPTLMRYSFVWQDMVTSGDPALTDIGRQVVASLEGDAFWVNIWRLPAPGAAKHYALRALRSQRIRAGWHVISAGALEWAWMPLPSTGPALFWPPSYEYWQGCVFVLIAPESVMHVLPHALQSPSLTIAATTGKVVPSPAWLTWCADNHGSLLYPAMHHNDREGMISVGAQRLPVRQWYAEQRIDQLFVGDEAYKAWQR